MSTKHPRPRTWAYRYDAEGRETVAREGGPAVPLPRSDRYSPDALKEMRDLAGYPDPNSLRTRDGPALPLDEGPAGFDPDEGPQPCPEGPED